MLAYQPEVQMVYVTPMASGCWWPHVCTDQTCGMQAKSAGGGVTCLTSGPRPALVSGSREGVITSWAVDSGIALQTIDITQVQPNALQKRLPAKGRCPLDPSLRLR